MADSAWANIRETVLRRDGYKCIEEGCSEICSPAELDVHHLIPRSYGGSDNPSNLITLCDGCHGARHPNLQVGLARRSIERWAVRLARWLDGREIPKEAEAYGSALRLFNATRFKDGQLEVINAALSGKSIIMVSATGSGKSLCFQLPGILRTGITLVISPLKTLMSDQISRLQKQKLPATYIHGDLSKAEKRKRYELLAGGAIKFFYCAPERFYVQYEKERAFLRRLRPDYIVIDEAHCVDKWGSDFRPEYGQLGELRRLLGSPPILAFTASAGRRTQQRILESLGIPDALTFVHGTNRPNIAFLRIALASEKRGKAIRDVLRLKPPGKTMIFVPTVRIGETLRAEFTELGLDIPFYHSKLGTPWDREQLLKRFSGSIDPAIDTLICTNAVGMGLDIPNVRMVVHAHPPASIEDYLQEYGRAGRDGHPALAVIFHHPRDGGLQEYMAVRNIEKLKDAEPGQREALLQSKKNEIQELAQLLAGNHCMRQSMINYFEHGLKKYKPSLANRLLTWIFSRDVRPKHISVCCDACAPALGKDHAQFIKTVFDQA